MINEKKENKKFLSLQILSLDKNPYTIKLFVNSNKLEIFVSNDSSLSLSYKLSMTMDNFQKLNKFFTI